jgi:predicted aspartyl protease
LIVLELAGRQWETIIDTGFNGDLELPLELKDLLPARFLGEVKSILAGGQSIVEVAYHVTIQFDGEAVLAEATFVESTKILLGTRLLRRHQLAIDFPARTVRIERA